MGKYSRHMLGGGVARRQVWAHRIEWPVVRETSEERECREWKEQSEKVSSHETDRGLKWQFQFETNAGGRSGKRGCPGVRTWDWEGYEYSSPQRNATVSDSPPNLYSINTLLLPLPRSLLSRPIPLSPTYNDIRSPPPSSPVIRFPISHRRHSPQP